jgi:hypothetical protein
MQKSPTLETFPQMRQKQRGLGVCGEAMGKEGRSYTRIPSILSEKTLFKITKFLSNPFLLFSHFLKVFQEFWAERGKTFQEH